MNTTKKLQDTDILSEEILNKEDCLNEKLTDKLTNERIEGTPLWCVKNNEEGTAWTLAFGKYALKTGHTKKELKEYVENNAIKVMTDITLCIFEELKNNTNNLKKDDSL